MSFATDIVKSTAQHRVLVEIDIGQENAQWVNYGSGIWVVNALNLYPWVEDELLEGFTAQDFGEIASVRADGISMIPVFSLGALTDSTNGFYYDAADRSLYVCLDGYDEPFLYRIAIGVLFGYSTYGFKPLNGPAYFEGRLASTPSFSVRRDPLFFGRFSYGGISAELINADGELDEFGASTDLYGQDARVLFGFADIDYSDYVQLFSGYVQAVTVAEDRVSLRIEDKRRQLSKAVTYSCTNLNALDAIREILLDNYGYQYNQSYYDLTAWAAAESLVESVTIDMQEPEPAIDVIESIAASVFGLFYVNAVGQFSFKVVEDETVDRVIPHYDIRGPHSIEYDPTQVLSSVRVGYNKDWATTGNAFTYLTDTSREADSFVLYKTYNQKTFDTLLPNASAATAFATRVLDYTDTVRGVESIVVPMENYDLILGQKIGVEVSRGEQPMLGEIKSEVIGIDYQLDTPAIALTIRHGRALESLLTLPEGDVIQLDDNALLMEE